MQFNRLTLCGIVVAVSWVLIFNQIGGVYDKYKSQKQDYACGYGIPHYPDRIALGEPEGFPFITTASVGQVTNFYHQRDPEHFPGPAQQTDQFILDYPSLNQKEDRFRFVFVLERNPPLVYPCDQLFLSIHDYGFVRVVMLLYHPLWSSPGLSR